MTSEDQELLNRIGQLAGQINRHKNQQAGLVSAPSHASSHYRGHVSTGYHPYHRAYAPRGGYRGGKPTAYRNRTLILNGASKGDKADGGDTATNADGAATNGPWVARRDRHMQLINANVYEKDSQARTKAIEQTRLQNQKRKDMRERLKLQNHLQYLANSQMGSTAGGGAGLHNGRSAMPYQVVVAGIPFSVAKNGSKLVKLPGDPNPPSSTPKTAIVGGVKFFRSKNGNLYRHGVVKAQRRAGTVKKIDQPCKMFSTTGSCSKGPMCRYMHNAAKVAACKDYLLKGQCANGADCDLSHDLTPERTPFCLHYAKGNCTNAHCPYTHSDVSTGAPVCRSFGLYGYCDKGGDCEDRHVFECPDFSNTGVCRTKGCKLMHRERASFMRRTNTGGADGEAGAEDADLVDASSDESVHSDDVDSDEVDEFVGAEGDDAAADFVTQKDYIEF